MRELPSRLPSSSSHLLSILFPPLWLRGLEPMQARRGNRGRGQRNGNDQAPPIPAGGHAGPDVGGPNPGPGEDQPQQPLLGDARPDRANQDQPGLVGPRRVQRRAQDPMEGLHHVQQGRIERRTNRWRVARRVVGAPAALTLTAVTMYQAYQRRHNLQQLWRGYVASAKSDTFHLLRT
ncbi:hypothetical protein F4778DRAFT_735111 [Xylariomycetidae sp. FL2044]|nr:hypothetical protein F4778DRAFT_735111 [Xylariomycetidae sp. FL2044]